MEFFEKFSKTVKEKSKAAAGKAKEVAGVAQLKIQISTQEELIKKNYQEMGKLYYELYSEMPEEPFRKACEGAGDDPCPDPDAGGHYGTDPQVPLCMTA